MGDPLHVEPARRHVRRDDGLDLARAQPADRLLALGLRHVAVHGLGGVATRLQALGQLGRARLGADEDQRGFRRFDLQHPRQRVGLLALGDVQVALLRLGDGDRRVLDLDALGIAQVPLGDATDFPRHRGREEGQLARAGHLAEDPLDVVDEPHAQHLVRLVEHDGLERVERQCAAPQVIHHAPWRADHDMDAGPEPPDLLLHRLAAVHWQHAQRAHPLGVRVDRLGHLDRELACGREHQRLDLGVVDVERLENRQRERRRLPGARLRLPDHVAAGKQGGDRARLDGGGRLVSNFFNGREERGAEAELGERGNHRAGPRCKAVATRDVLARRFLMLLPRRALSS